MDNTTGDQALQEARRLYDANHLPFPPIPTELAQRLVRIGEWLYGTRRDLPSPYLTEKYIHELREGVDTDYVVFGHAGHGTMSYALHFYLVQGPLALFLQHSWGNADSDPARDVETIARDYALADQIIRAVPKAASLRLPQRLVVYYSNLRMESRWALWAPGSEDPVWNYTGYRQGLAVVLDMVSAPPSDWLPWLQGGLT